MGWILVEVEINIQIGGDQIHIRRLTTEVGNNLDVAGAYTILANAYHEARAALRERNANTGERMDRIEAEQREYDARKLSRDVVIGGDTVGGAEVEKP